MTLGIASDHGGYDLKSYIIQHCEDIAFLDLGCHSSDRVDYPLIADALCSKILSNEIKQGILICGTGIGISMRANRYSEIRAAVVHDEYTATMAKAHNNANIICLGGRITDPKDALSFIHVWMTTVFESGRHQDRIELIDTPIQ